MSVKNIIAWRGALARTGGTVCEGIIKHLFQQAGYTCKPIAIKDFKSWYESEETPEEGYQSMLTHLESLQEGPYVGGSDCFFSSLFRSPVFRVVFVRRDPRQALASFRRLTKMPSSKIPTVLDRWMCVYEQCMTLPNTRCLVLDYDTEILPLFPAVQRMADFLGLSLPVECLEATAALFSRDTMRNKLHSRATKTLECLRDLQTTIRGEFAVVRIRDFGQDEVFRIPKEAFDAATIESSTKRQAQTTTRKIALLNGTTLTLPSNKDGESFRLGPLISPKTNHIDEEQAAEHFHLDHIATTKQHWSAAFTQEECKQIDSYLASFLQKHGFEL